MSATILVVDDDADLREFLTVLLATEGYAVFSASDEEQATALFNANTVDLVIVDLVMPKINGVTLLKQFKQTKPAVRSIIFSAMLGHHTIGQHRRRLEELADRLLEKPVRSEDFLGTVRELLASTS